MPFDSVDPKQSFPDLERGILKYWKEEDTFKRSMQRRKDNEVFSFYDGPPFATGLPHYGHILAGTIKDVIPRYQTMRGKYVQRRFGWDCHGLPIENLIEKEQNLNTKQDIEHMGIATFNDHCRTAVKRYTKEWREVVERMGRWVDMDFDYRTMDPEFMESIWWVFAQLFDQKLIYEGHKPMHICPRCQTPLSNFEVTQGYKDIQDQTVTAMFELENEEVNMKNEEWKGKTYFLAWTTTPWTLPGNLFLAVHPEVTYVTVLCDGNRYIIAKDLAEKVFAKKEYTFESEQLGSALIGKKYHPLFPYFAHRYAEKAFRVVGGEFVTVTDGTGIVHIAPGYGDDDFHVGAQEGVDLLQHVGIDGLFTKDVVDFAGKHAKPKDDHQSGDKMIAKHLKEKGHLFASESYVHSYPHCWRCDSPLLNYATSSWFVAVEKIKEKMLESNAKTQWVPEHIRDGRFGKWLEGARDWAISRNRFWGTPLPLWRNTITGETHVIRSRDELMELHPERFTKVIVMRHAESEGNVKQIYQGAEPGTPLTALGTSQAKATAEHIQAMSGVKPSSLYASPLLRTQETAEIVGSVLNIPVHTDSRLREISFGDYEGKHINFDDLAFIRDKRAHKMSTGKVESIYHFDGMETWQESSERITSFLDDVLARHRGETIIIVTHADLIMNMKQYFTGEDPHKIVHQPFPALAESHTFFFDHTTKKAMDLHKDTVDSIVWKPKKQDASLEVSLTVVRHGETDFNAKRLVQGSELDPSLNEKGQMQAKELAEMLKGQTFDVVLSSPRNRSKETAEILAQELNLPSIVLDEAFLERGFGVLSGKPIDEVMKTYGPINPPKGLTPVWLKFSPEGGESFDQFISRIDRGLLSILKQYAGKRVLLVAHGGVVRATKYIQGESYEAIMDQETKNCGVLETTLYPTMKRIPEVLDCWFESGSMPYAQVHFPFEKEREIPPQFPADFIAEGLDQTRGWFYTLMVLSTALFNCPPFRHCIVNGIVLAEDGKKMSKRLKNYPEPTEIVEKHGADAVRFALMMSPAVRGEDLRFSEKLVVEVVRSVLLPLWNVYRLFVTYANAAEFVPSIDFSLRNASSTDILDRWMILKTQSLINRMTSALNAYDLSATCAELTTSIDDLTNWYVRLSRRRFAGMDEEQSDINVGKNEQHDALDTLYRVLLAHCQMLAPFCPFITEAIYLNLVGEEHESIHFTDWPASAEISEEEEKILAQMDATHTIVSLGLSLRSNAKIRVRQPLASISVVVPPSLQGSILTEIILEELNVKKVIQLDDASLLGTASVLVDARKVGPRLGGKVQEIIKAGKSGQFEETADGFTILGETFSNDEAKLVYQGKEGSEVASDHGIVVSIDTTATPELSEEGDAREIIHAIQKARKDAGMEFTDTITLTVHNADHIMSRFAEMICTNTRSVLGVCSTHALQTTVVLESGDCIIFFEKV